MIVLSFGFVALMMAAICLMYLAYKTKSKWAAIGAVAMIGLVCLRVFIQALSTTLLFGAASALAIFAIYRMTKDKKKEE